MKSTLLKLVVVTCALLGNLALAAEDPNYPYANSEPEQMLQGMSQMSSSVNLPFDPNDYNFLIYDCGGDSSENQIQAAMQKLGLEYTLCNSSNPVTSNLLHTHDILIVGWAAGGNKSGLDPSIIEEGITGRVILSGHDSDYHTVNVEAEDAATTFFIQEIDYVLKGVSTGLIVCADIDSNFDWLPDSWEIESTANGGSTITEFTQDGVDSGIYDNLTPALMSGWSTSFHNTFTSWGDGFKLFELGQGDVDVTIAAPINPNGFDFVKEDGLIDEIECAAPEDEITYTICYDNTTDWTFYDCFIVDFLADEVDYPAGIGSYVFDGNSIQFAPGDPGYNEEEHYYVWDIGTIAPDDANCVSLTVTMNQKAEPGMLVHNVAELWGTVYDPNGQNPTEILIARATEDTRVCCWDTEPNVIYVDQSAGGNDTGIDWANAYRDLADALVRARDSICGGPFTVYVAQGVYDPNHGPGKSFVLPEGCAVYGGFKPGGCSVGQRNPKRYETILTGLIDDDAFPDADKVVTMGDESLLDGFTVTGSADYGIYGNGADFKVEDCSVENNERYGIRAINGDLSIKWSIVKGNGDYGIRQDGQGYTLSVENSKIIKNLRYGVYCVQSTPIIKNSIISESDLKRDGHQGIRMINPTYSPVLHNNTIVHNKALGISFVDNGNINGDPNYPDWPDVQNCILWYNNAGGDQIAGFEQDLYANYCCIQDCNVISTTNINDEPKFAYIVYDPNAMGDPNNIHLAYNDTVCKDAGNPFLTYSGQVDIDGEGLDRKYGSYIDIGADEVYSCDDDMSEDDIYNPLDWDADGIVNYEEFNVFSKAWLTKDPNVYTVTDPNVGIRWFAYGKQCDLSGDDQVNLDDLEQLYQERFIDNWLWIACWKSGEIMEQMAMSGGEESMSMVQTLSMETMLSVPAALPTEETLVEVLHFVEYIIENEDPANKEALLDLVTYLEDELKAVRKENK